MTPEIFAPSIAAHSKAFTDWLGKDSDRPFVVAADSRDEALAFLAWMFEQTDAGATRGRSRMEMKGWWTRPGSNR